MRLSSLLLCCIVICLCPRALAKAEITMSAAISLKPLLDDVLRQYQASQDVAIGVDYGASGILARRISQGAPVDLFIAGAPEHVDLLSSAGLLQPDSRREIARGSMVLVTTKGKGGIASFQDLAKPQVKRVAIGDPKTVPAGLYASEIISFLGMNAALSGKLVKGSNARQVMTYVEHGDVDAGIVYKSDALASPNLMIVAYPEAAWYQPVRYEVAQITRSKVPEAAQKLVEFLSSKTVQEALGRHGLDLPTPKTAASRTTH